MSCARKYLIANSNWMLGTSLRKSFPRLFNSTQYPLILIQEAITFYFSQRIQNANIKKRGQFYQDKIKKLLSRKDVEKCLVGKRMNPKSIDIEHQI